MKKTLKVLTFIQILIVFTNFSFSQDYQSLANDDEVEFVNNISLMEKLQVSIIETGEYVFLKEKKEMKEHLADFLKSEKIIWENVEDFGFIVDEATQLPYVYILEKKEDGMRTAHIPLQVQENRVSSLIKTAKGPVIPITICISQGCCTSCVWWQGACACYNGIYDCPGGPLKTCEAKTIYIHFK